MTVLLQHEWIHAILVPQHWVLDRECKNILIKNMQEYKGDLKEWRSSLFKVHFLFSQNVKNTHIDRECKNVFMWKFQILMW
jgi:hypothetical protein